MKRAARKKSTSAVEATSAASWIVREVSFATYKRKKEIDAKRLTASLELLSSGVDEWNAYRVAHPRFRPYLRNANLSWSNKALRGDWDGMNLSHAELQESDLTGRSLQEADLTNANLSGATLIDIGLQRAVLDEASLRGADLDEAHLQFAELFRADLSGANLHDAELACASVQRASLRYATLDGAEASDLIATGADFFGARLIGSDLSGADLSDANLSHATLVGTDLSGANLHGARVYGASVWDVNTSGTVQSGLLINDENDDARIVVDDLEVAQFIYMLVNHKKLRKAINAIAGRGVLLLGQFADGGHDVLLAIAEKLRELDYLPILFDFDRPEERNYTETVKILAGLSRFVIANLSGPSVPQELTATVPHYKIPFVLLVEEGRKPYSMVVDILEYPWVVRPVVKYANVEDLLGKLPSSVVAPAEARVAERQQLLETLFANES